LEIGPGESACRPCGLLFIDIFFISFYFLFAITIHFCLLVLFVFVFPICILFYYSFCLLVLVVFVCLPCYVVFFFLTRRVVAVGTSASSGGDVALIIDHALAIAPAIGSRWYVGQPVVWRQHPPTPNTYITM
jgi:hypothetical protein